MTPSPRRSLATPIALVLGSVLAGSILWCIHWGPWQHEELIRYTHHPAEQASVLLFCFGIMALLIKLLGVLSERAVLGRQLIPAWDGKVRPVSEVSAILNHLERQRGWAGSWMPDNRSFAYRRERKREPGEPAVEERKRSRSFLHVLGTNPDGDKPIFGYGVDPRIEVAPALFPLV